MTATSFLSTVLVLALTVPSCAGQDTNALLGDLFGSDVSKQFKKAEQQVELAAALAKDPVKGTLILSCGKFTADMVYGFTASAPPHLQSNADFQQLRSLLIGHVLECQKKTMKHEQLIASGAAGQFGALLTGLQGGRKSAATEAFAPGMCEPEYKLCVQYIKDMCNVSSPLTEYNPIMMSRLVQQIRYMPGVKGVCDLQDRNRLLAFAKYQLENKPTTTTPNPLLKLLGEFAGGGDGESGGLLSGLMGGGSNSGGLLGGGGGLGSLLGGGGGLGSLLGKKKK